MYFRSAVLARVRTPTLLLLYLRQARIQDFAQGGATAKRGPEARGPKVPPIKKQKSADLVHYFLVGAPLPWYFIFFLFNLILFYRSGGGGGGPPGPVPPPPPTWIRP